MMSLMNTITPVMLPSCQSGEVMRVHATDSAICANRPHFKLRLVAAQSAFEPGIRFLFRFSRNDHTEFVTKQD